MRDYLKYPIQHGEDIPKEDIYELYINQNWTRDKCAKYFGVGTTKMDVQIKLCGFIKTPEQRKQAKLNSNIEKYGTTHPRKNKKKNKEINSKIEHTRSENLKHTCSIQTNDLLNNTIKWLNSLNIEIPDYRIETKHHLDINIPKNLLIAKYHNVKFNYKETRYPFRCDFYLPDFDIFIEYQSFKGHGEHPFNYNNPDDIARLLYWVEKADMRKLDRRNKYLAYVHTWVERDPMKRECAKKYKLNWFEFFTLDDFMKWYYEN